MKTWHNAKVRCFVIVSGLVMLLVVSCSSDDTNTSATSTSNSQSGTGAAASGGAGPGGSSSQGGQGGEATETFACRDNVQCIKEQEYCNILQPGANGADPVITCEPLPKECEPLVECKCLGLMGPRCMCQESAEGDLQVTCMGI